MGEEQIPSGALKSFGRIRDALKELDPDKNLHVSDLRELLKVEIKHSNTK